MSSRQGPRLSCALCCKGKFSGSFEHRPSLHSHISIHSHTLGHIVTVAYARGPNNCGLQPGMS